MLRNAVTIFALLGLLLSGGLWARSHFWIDTLLIPTSRPDHFEASSILGVIHVGLAPRLRTIGRWTSPLSRIADAR